MCIWCDEIRIAHMGVDCGALRRMAMRFSGKRRADFKGVEGGGGKKGVEIGCAKTIIR